MDAAEVSRINAALLQWRQGDAAFVDGLFFLHLADLNLPLVPSTADEAARRSAGEEPLESLAGIASEVPGVVIVSQACDIVRSCEKRPWVEVSPVIEVTPPVLEEVRRLKRPSYAYLPGLADRGLVANLDRTMTVEKSVVAAWTRIPTVRSDKEVRDLAAALARKRERFAFPNDFIDAVGRFNKWFKDKHSGGDAEGAMLRALGEVRLRAAPSWAAEHVSLFFWFIKDEEDPDPDGADWAAAVDRWTALIDTTGRFSVEGGVACRLKDISGEDYIESDRLDFEQLSTAG